MITHFIATVEETTWGAGPETPELQPKSILVADLVDDSAVNDAGCSPKHSLLPAVRYHVVFGTAGIAQASLPCSNAGISSVL